VQAVQTDLSSTGVSEGLGRPPAGRLSTRFRALTPAGPLHHLEKAVLQLFGTIFLVLGDPCFGGESVFQGTLLFSSQCLWWLSLCGSELCLLGKCLNWLLLFPGLLSDGATGVRILGHSGSQE
jgi:hypothetical protein